MNSFLSGFYKLSPEERLNKVASEVNLTNDEINVINGKQGFTTGDADRMIENVIGYMPVPLGVAVNFKVNGKDCFVPMATEEPSVVAAASHAAKLTYNNGGFTTSYSGSIMRGQVQITDLQDPYGALARVYENKETILQLCNEQDLTLESFGGGAKNIDVQMIQAENGEKMVIVHLLIDTKDAMGANAVNTMAEAASPLLEKITGGNVVLRILSNLADQRIIRARAVFKNPFQKVQETQKFMYAHQLAHADPYRAATHNKGIMNGISAVVLATGNDTRAIEAGAHAYAAASGSYRSLTQWELDEHHNIIGTIALPLAAGLVGGATQSHPTAKLATKIMQVETAEHLASIVASAGLAQNFAALKALAGEGIQKGHMKLHARNMAAMAGAKAEEIEQVVELATKQGKFRYDDIKQFVRLIQKS